DAALIFVRKEGPAARSDPFLSIGFKTEAEFRLEPAAPENREELPVLVGFKEDPMKTVSTECIGKPLQRLPLSLTVQSLLDDVQARVAGRKRQRFFSSIDQANQDCLPTTKIDNRVRIGDE